MNAESYGKFSEWLIGFKTERLVSSEFLFNEFEKSNNFKIIFFDKERYN